MKTEVEATLFLRDVDRFRIDVHAPSPEPAHIQMGPEYDDAAAFVALGAAQIWTRKSETFRALAAALNDAADQLDAVRAEYERTRAEQASESVTAGV